MNKLIIFLFLFLFPIWLFSEGEADFLSLKVHFLSEKSGVVLNAANDKDERIEVFLSILDKDGNLATKNSTGGTLLNIDNDVLTSEVEAKLSIINDINNRDISKKNTARFILDYSDVTTTKLEDTITVNMAGLKKSINAKFEFVSAKGLIVRVATRTIDPKLYQGKYFSNITPDGDNNLSLHSKTFPGGTVGVSVPLKIYATTRITQKDADDQDKRNYGLSGSRFTRSKSLDNSVVVVKALADFDANGRADIVIAEAEGRMQDGIAKIDILITKGMPEDKDNYHSSFNKKVFEGLGIAFIAYLKDDLSVSNRGILKKSYFSDPSKFHITGDHNATDTTVIRSLAASNMRLGDFNRSVKFLDSQWKNIHSNYYVLDDNDISTEQNIILTAIDRYGNPAKPSTTARVSLSYDDIDNDDMRYFDIYNNGNFADKDKYSIYTQKITMKPNVKNTKYKSRKGINNFVEDSKRVYTKLKILGTGGLSSADAVNTVVYAGRVSKNYIINKGYSTNLSQDNISFGSGSNDRDFKVVVSQLDINSTKMKVQIYERDLSGAYGTRDSSSKYDPKFKGSSARSGIDMTAGGSIGIDDMKSITIQAYTKSSTTPLDGFTVYFFKEEGAHLDNYVVILPSSSSDVFNGNKETRVEPGSTINFTLYGLASNIGDYMHVRHGAVGDKSIIGLSKNQAPNIQGDTSYRNEAGDFIGNNLALSIKGYTLDADDKFSIYVNGHLIDKDRIISRASDQKIDDRESDGLYHDIEFGYEGNHISDVTQINIAHFGAVNSSSGDGSTKTSLLELNDMNGDGIDASVDDIDVEPITYKGKVYANKYYLLFNNKRDLKEMDAFGNELKTYDGGYRKLSKYDYDTSGRGEIGEAGGEVYIKFDPRDAGKVIEAEIESRHASNTIKFTNIIASFTNDFYVIAPEDTTPQINLVNAEVTIRVVGNNNGASDDFSLQLSHSDTSANIYLTKIEKDKKEDFETKTRNSIYEPLVTDGNYYILRTDKPGHLTIAAKGLEEDKNGKNVTVSKSNVLRFVNFDRAPPLANAVIIGNSVKVTIEDGSLDYDRTIVEARDSEGKTVKKSVRIGNEYTVSQLAKGSYQIYIYAIDLFDNEFSNTFTRVITSDGVVDSKEQNTSVKQPSLTEQDAISKLSKTLMDHDPYPTYGKFIAYNGTDRYYLNWIFQESISSQAYKLFAIPSSIDPFGFKAFDPDLTKIDSSKWWYMIKLDGSIGSLDASGSYGWVVINQGLNVVKKLKTSNSDGTLTYTTLPIKVKLESKKIVFYK